MYVKQAARSCISAKKARMLQQPQPLRYTAVAADSLLIVYVGVSAAPVWRARNTTPAKRGVRAFGGATDTRTRNAVSAPLKIYFNCKGFSPR
jgi:hypothetical protein